MKAEWLRLWSVLKEWRVKFDSPPPEKASFLERTEFDFTASKYSILGETNVYDDVLKGALFIGPNASGKSNALKGIAFIVKLIKGEGASFLRGKYVKKYTDPYGDENGNQGQLLLSYPSVESYLLSCIQNDVFKQSYFLGRDVKLELDKVGFSEENIETEDYIIHAAEEMGSIRQTKSFRCCH